MRFHATIGVCSGFLIGLATALAGSQPVQPYGASPNSDQEIVSAAQPTCGSAVHRGSGRRTSGKNQGSNSPKA